MDHFHNSPKHYNRTASSRPSPKTSSIHEEHPQVLQDPWKSARTLSSPSQFHEEHRGVLDSGLDLLEEEHGLPAVYQPVVVCQRNVHHRPHLNLVRKVNKYIFFILSLLKVKINTDVYRCIFPEVIVFQW